MNIQFFFITFSFFCLAVSCSPAKSDKPTSITEEKKAIAQVQPNLLTDVVPLFEDGDVNAVIEIPAGTMDKWELNKSTGQVEWEMIDQKPRVVNFIGYPGNYGMIPQTLLSKEKGGDGDPLDILVLGPPAERGGVVKCKIIGILFLMDRGEQDDKLIAVSDNSPLYGVQDMADLNENYNGISDIIQTWFTNYKGPGKMESKGFGNKTVALEILESSINEYKSKHAVVH